MISALALLFLSVAAVSAETTESRLLDLETKYAGLLVLLQKRTATSQNLQEEIDTLKQSISERILTSEHSLSSTDVEKDLQKMQLRLDNIETGLQAEKSERHRIVINQNEIKDWVDDVVNTKELEWKEMVKTIKNKSSVRETDYREFLSKVNADWNTWKQNANKTLISTLEDTRKLKSESSGAIQEIKNDVMKFGDRLKCYGQCENGWEKRKCSCLKKIPNFASFNKAEMLCQENGARILTPSSVKQLKEVSSVVKAVFFWIDARKDGNSWKYGNGTNLPSEFEVRGPGKCAYAIHNKVGVILVRSSSCLILRETICEKSPRV